LLYGGGTIVIGIEETVYMRKVYRIVCCAFMNEDPSVCTLLWKKRGLGLLE